MLQTLPLRPRLDKSAVNQRRYWCCRSCALDPMTSTEFPLNEPTDPICTRCRRPCNNEANRVESLICRNFSLRCCQINNVEAEICENKDCREHLPNHRDDPRAIDTGQFIKGSPLLISRAGREKLWVCTTCSSLNGSGKFSCGKGIRKEKERCSGRRDEGVWVITRGKE